MLLTAAVMKACQIVAGGAPPWPPVQPPIVGSVSSTCAGLALGLSVNMPTAIEYCGMAPTNQAWEAKAPVPRVPVLAIIGRLGQTALGTPVPFPAPGIDELSNDSA